MVARNFDRRRLGVLIIAICVVCLTAPMDAGQFNRVLEIGKKAPVWEPLPGVDGQSLGSSQLEQSPVTVVVFTCNSCPYAVDVEKRLVDLQSWMQQKGGKLVAINVNKGEEDRLEAMKERAETVGFQFPYLWDETQRIARLFGATTTPEFFVLDRNWNVAYMGALDDSPDGKAVAQSYVRQAVDALLTKQKVEVAETVPIGCRIRFERSRRGS